MNNQTTVTTGAIAGALALLTIWLASYFLPELMETVPTGGEAALTILFTAVIQYFTPAKEE